jgi:hypothetical protein
MIRLCSCPPDSLLFSQWCFKTDFPSTIPARKAAEAAANISMNKDRTLLSCNKYPGETAPWKGSQQESVVS